MVSNVHEDDSPVTTCILVLDGHGSHITIDVIEFAKLSVYLLCLPSHTSHILQPLDVSVFKPFKSFSPRLVATWPVLLVVE